MYFHPKLRQLFRNLDVCEESLGDCRCMKGYVCVAELSLTGSWERT